MMVSVIDRIEAKLDKSAGPDGCWMWLGAQGQKGGPRTTIRKKSANPRHIIWELVHGEPLPKNRQITTTCKVPQCLNPAHFALMPWHDDEARFWSFVQKGDGCWAWTGATFRGGYGAFRRQGKICHAHRVSYELANGTIEGHVPGHPELEVVVMHRCDNPNCVRPDHLELGTDADNIADMWRKGRGSKGAKHGAAVKAAHRRKVS